MKTQLSLFEIPGLEFFRIGAESLLNLLNQDMKPKDHYIMQFYYQHEDLYVLIASNKEKNIVCNVVDINGDVPDSFCVNWRSHQLVLEELKYEYLKRKK